MRRTKIVATVGPASRDPERLAQLIEAGVDVFRLNFSHGTHEEHLQVVKAVREMVTYAHSLCADIEFSPEDAGRSDPNFLYEVLGVAIECGATTVTLGRMRDAAEAVAFYHGELAERTGLRRLFAPVVDNYKRYVNRTIALTGWMQTTVAYFGVDWVGELHEVLVTWAELSVAAHIAAVVLESRRLRVNLPKSMVTGYKDFVQD